MKHPNRVPFEGVLTVVGVPSDKAPSGARGHLVILDAKAVANSLHTLLGMGVGYKVGWDGHNARQKVGVISEATIKGSEVRVRGYIYGNDFPEVSRKSAESELGMSFELIDAQVEDLRKPVWRLTRFCFSGGAILLREKAAYRETSFRLLDPEEEC